MQVYAAEDRGDPVDIANGLAMLGLPGALRAIEIGLRPLSRSNTAAYYRAPPGSSRRAGGPRFKTGRSLFLGLP